jgi:hypothetical protein
MDKIRFELFVCSGIVIPKCIKLFGQVEGIFREGIIWQFLCAGIVEVFTNSSRDYQEWTAIYRKV